MNTTVRPTHRFEKPSYRAGDAPRLALLVAMVLGVLVVWGCQPSASNCEDDSDCDGGQVCASGGGLLVSGGVCVLRDFEGVDAGLDGSSDGPSDGSSDSSEVDANCEPTSCASAGIVCGSIDDGCGGTLACGPAGCIVDIGAGLSHTCAIRRSGEFFCWGANGSGQLGDGTSTSSNTPVAGQPPEPDFMALEVVAGNNHTCARGADASVWCWGLNQFGQLGTGDPPAEFPSTERPQREVDLSAVDGAVIELEAALNTNCLRTDAGGVFCWGRGAEGQIGNGEQESTNPSPVAIGGLEEPALSVALSSCYGCAATADGLMCWGDFEEGCGGDGLPGSATEFSSESLDASVSLAGGDGHTCFTRPGGSAHCFNENDLGQLGVDPATTTRSQTPVDVAALSTAVVDVVAGAKHSCALDDQGRVFCWGDNRVGQLGNGGDVSSFEPVQVGLSDTATLIAAGVEHTCAALSSGAVECWGNNAGGQLGNGQAGGEDFSSVPVPALF